MKQEHRGRIQAQGGGTQKSVKWVQDSPLTSTQGIELLEHLKGLLTPAEMRARAQGFKEAEAYIRRAERAGGVRGLYKKTFPPALPTDAPRVDLEVTVGLAFIESVR